VPPLPALERAAVWLAARLEALKALFERRSYPAINHAPKTPPARFWRACAGAKRWLCSRFGRYRHLPPSPRAKRGQYLGARGLFFWGVFGCLAVQSKASPTPSGRRGCAAHAGESLEILGWNPFFTLRAGNVTTVKGERYYGERGTLLRWKGNVTTVKGERYYGERGALLRWKGSVTTVKGERYYGEKGAENMGLFTATRYDNACFIVTELR